MKGVKVGLLGVCLSLMGLAVASNNIIAIGLGFIGLAVSVAALFVKEDTYL